MNEKEAINVLRKNKPVTDPRECGIELCEACDIAIKAIEENEDLFFKLEGVMHFVDKFLEGDELKLDEVQRADLMREKVLRLLEN